MKLLLEKLVVIQRVTSPAATRHGGAHPGYNRAGTGAARVDNFKSGFREKRSNFQTGRSFPWRFFDRSLSIRTIIKEMIEHETTPLSDTEIKERLEKDGITIARRTVAKYRSMEGILPTHLRQKSPGSSG